MSFGNLYPEEREAAMQGMALRAAPPQAPEVSTLAVILGNWGAGIAACALVFWIAAAVWSRRGKHPMPALKLFGLWLAVGAMVGLARWISVQMWPLSTDENLETYRSLALTFALSPALCAVLIPLAFPRPRT